MTDGDEPQRVERLAGLDPSAVPDSGASLEPDAGAEPGVGGASAEPVTPARRRRARVLATITAVVVVVVAVAVAGPRVLPAGDSHGAFGSTGAPIGLGGNAAADGASGAALDAEVSTLLTARGTAVRRDDAGAWRRTQTSDAHVPVFARLAALPLTRWSYHVESIEEADDPRSVVAVVTVRYRYDVDATDAVLKERLTLRRVATGWLVAAESTADSRAEPWDLGPLTVVSGRASLVIGIDVSRAVARRYAALADAVTPDVTAVWGPGWNQHPVVIVPRSSAMLGRGLGRTAASLEDFAAVTVSEGGTSAGAAMRVWTNTSAMASLSALGREIVLRHEVTHVATAAPVTPSVPLWLEEGFAEYVGYLGSRIPVGEALSELATSAQRSGAPKHLPAPSAFTGPQVDVAYESADLACRYIADTYGRAALVRVYRLTAAGTGSDSANVDSALRAVTGLDTAGFEAVWRARIARLEA
jgi:hypothetical protein